MKQVYRIGHCWQGHWKVQVRKEADRWPGKMASGEAKVVALEEEGERGKKGGKVLPGDGGRGRWKSCKVLRLLDLAREENEKREGKEEKLERN